MELATVRELALDRATSIQSSVNQRDVIHATSALAKYLEHEGVPLYVLEAIKDKRPSKTWSLLDLGLTSKGLRDASKRSVIDFAVEAVTFEETPNSHHEAALAKRTEAYERALQTLSVASNYGIKVDEVFAELENPSMVQSQSQVASR